MRSMNIFYNEQTNSFHLTNEKLSYQLSVENEVFLAHTYFGKRIENNHSESDYPLGNRLFSVNPSSVPGREFSVSTLPQEYPGNNNGDFRESAFEFRYQDGSFHTQLNYSGYDILEGKPSLKGLPQTYVNSNQEARTLKIILLDPFSGIEVHLFYTIFEQYAVITRSVQVINKGREAVSIEKVLSASIDFDRANFDSIQLSGGWAREREIERSPIFRGVHKTDSKRGTTSHAYQPFVALANSNTTEHTGEVYGFHLVYSGEFTANVEVNEYKQTRVQMGINPEHFQWTLDAGEVFQAPEVVMVYSDTGLNGMSQELHRLYQNQLVRGEHQFKERPVLINNWEGTYFDFTEEKIESIAEEASKLGFDLFVLDDGWFGKRNDDLSSLGDWFVNKEKLPNGLKTLAEKIRSKGMKFGLWFEPEMISEDSDLYREHPEWVLKAKNSLPSRGREQYMLDFSQRAVRQNIFEQMKKILDDVPIDYIKWDFNRNMSEIGSQHPDIRDGEVAHRYILGLYELLENLTRDYPHILFENCSGGGGRYDPGMLYYMPQTWASDNSDAVSRLEIQTGTSLIMPISSMGAHVSAVPNHQTGRLTSLKMRGDVAMSGNLGYELDLTTLTDREKAVVKEQIIFYKKFRSLIQFGTFHRIISPFDGANETSWIFVNENKSEALFYYYRILDKGNTGRPRVKLVGLDPIKKYRINDSEQQYFGNELMNKGVYVHAGPAKDEQNQGYHGDFRSLRLLLTEID